MTPTDHDEKVAARTLWAIITSLGAVVLLLMGFSVTQVTARIGVLEVTAQEQAILNREREARLTRLESVANSIVPDMKAQLNRIEAKVDTHMSVDARGGK